MMNGHCNVVMMETNETISNNEINEVNLDNGNSSITMDDQISPRIKITFYQISKVIDIPSKMIDSQSKEKIIQRTLLDRVSGEIHPGEIVALMGPSGCGKTTLLNVLAGRKLEGVTGQICLNDQLYQRNMKRIFGYVLQEDIFFEELTVKQQLTFTALLRLPNHLTKKDKFEQIQRIIEQLRLEQCSNVPIKLISGGEKKRVNIATELLTNPSVIFLDEPTSGLDSTSAVILLSVLRELSNNGKTILTSIHQPSSQIFQSFDKLILLADGKTVFMGQPKNVINYFSSIGYPSPPQYNPADFIMDLVNQDRNIREELKEIYMKKRFFINKNEENDHSKRNESDVNTNEDENYLIGEPNGYDKDLINDEKRNLEILMTKKENKWPIGFPSQTLILFKRNWILTSKSQLSKLNCIQALLMSFLYGFLWLRMKFREDTLNDRSSFLIFMMIFWPLEICFQGILSIPSERSVINKERASGLYRLSSYYFAKCLSETPLKLVLPSISFTIAYWMANINPTFSIFLAILVFLLIVVLVAESFGVLLGAVFPSVGEAWVMGNVILIANLLTCGYFIENMPHWIGVWTKWLSFYKYAYDACIQLLFQGEHRYQCVNGNQIEICRNQINGTFNGEQALQYFHVDLNIGLNFLVLIGIIFTFRISAYIALRFIKHNDARS